MKHKFMKSVLATAMMLTSVSLWAETIKQNVTTAAVAGEQKKSGIDQQYFDNSVRANDDFFQYTNGLWLKNTEIPADKSGWGTFYVLEEESLQRLHGIVEDLSKQKNAEGSTEQKVASLYADFMNEKVIDDLGIKPIQAEIDRVDAIKSKKDIAQISAHFSRIGVTSPFDVGIEQDMKKSTEMIAMLGQSGLGLPDRDYYLKDDAKFKQTRADYLVYIEKTLNLAGDKQAPQHAKDILKLETQIAKVQWTNVQNRDVPKLYNIYKTEDLVKLNPNIDWKAYLDGQGLTDKISKIQVVQPSYFQGLSPIVDNTSLDAWKAYFKFHLISDFSSLLSKDFVDNSFDFYGHKLRDIKEQKVRWKRGVALVNGGLGECLGKIYVEQYFSPDKKQRMEQLVQNLMKAYSQSIEQLDWMSFTTKVQAQKKLSSITVKIGYPKKWRDYSALEIKPNDLVGNILRGREFMHQIELSN